MKAYRHVHQLRNTNLWDKVKVLAYSVKCRKSFIKTILVWEIKKSALALQVNPACAHAYVYVCEHTHTRQLAQFLITKWL